MKNLVAQLLSNGISRRDFVRRLVATGVTATAATLDSRLGYRDRADTRRTAGRRRNPSSCFKGRAAKRSPSSSSPRA